jgi:zinc/manganese transport system substrate-binding protein
MVFKKYKRETALWLFFMLCIILVSACDSSTNSGNSASSSSSATIAVVAAENFYGDIVSQLGGSHVSVTSVISDPNIDPHEFEANPKYVRAVGIARLVIANGGGYDDWMDKLLASTPNDNRLVLKGFDIATVKLPDNEHIWYSYVNVGTIAEAITEKLKTLDSSHASEYDRNLQTFKLGLQKIQDKIGEIKSKYSGTAVGLTETIFQYQAVPLNLDVKTPQAFQKAMAEGNDPPASTVAMAEDQISKKQIKVLIYNQQTASKITDTLQIEAKAQNIPIVPVTETMPPGKNYQTWMLDQLNLLEQDLGK